MHNVQLSLKIENKLLEKEIDDFICVNKCLNEDLINWADNKDYNKPL
jgi:hypothetical protein